MSNEAIIASPIYQELLQEKDALRSELESFKIQFNNLLKLINGSKQERFIPAVNPEQQNLFHIPAPEVMPVPEKIIIERSKPVKKKDAVIEQGKRLPANLRREVEEFLPSEDLTGCKRIGEEESEQLHFKPGELYVKVTRRPKFAKADGEGILIAEMPDRIKSKSILGNSLVAKIITDKYVYHTPLYRQSKQMIELGAEVAVSTMADSVGYAYEALLPLYEKAKELIFAQAYLQADETPIKVLDSNVKGKAHLGYMWAYRAPQTDLVYFDYRKGRGREGPQECLKDFKGFLQTDGYQVYDAFALKPDITLVGCMAHARRKFFDAQDNDRNRAAYVLTEISKLYKIEKELRDSNANPKERFEARQQAIPIIDSLKQWMDAEAIKVLPKSAIGQAMSYTMQRWDKLKAYLKDGSLEIDNNMIENAIRPIALGRKNYMFAGSHPGAQRAAMMYTFFAMCKVNDIPPMQWLEKTLDQLPSHPINRIAELLPLKK